MQNRKLIFLLIFVLILCVSSFFYFRKLKNTEISKDLESGIQLSPSPAVVATSTAQTDDPITIDSKNPVASVAVSSVPSRAPTATPRVSLRWGAYVGDTLADGAVFERLVGQKPDMQALFISWADMADGFPVDYGPSVRDRGTTLVIFWEAQDSAISSPVQPKYNYDSVIRGDWDEYFAAFAAGAKIYGGPTIIVPFDEMNGNWSPWSGTLNGNTPAKHIAAYRHIREFFRDNQQIKFGWTVNSDSQPDITGNHAEDYYPGDSYVDYIGVDGFNFDEPWMSFDEVFRDSLSRIAKYPKPLIIFSFASAEGPRKAAWITDALIIQIPKIPRIAGWIWFNEKKEKNWLISSDSQSLAAFKAALVRK